jgi:hypothetical protein
MMGTLTQTCTSLQLLPLQLLPLQLLPLLLLVLLLPLLPLISTMLLLQL